MKTSEHPVTISRLKKDENSGLPYQLLKYELKAGDTMLPAIREQVHQASDTTC